MLKDKPTKDINAEPLAAKTKGYSGADLKAVVDLAIEAKLRQAMEAHAPNSRLLDTAVRSSISEYATGRKNPQIVESSK